LCGGDAVYEVIDPLSLTKQYPLHRVRHRINGAKCGATAANVATATAAKQQLGKSKKIEILFTPCFPTNNQQQPINSIFYSYPKPYVLLVSETSFYNLLGISVCLGYISEPDQYIN